MAQVTTEEGRASFARLREQLDEIQETLRAQGLDAWVLYDLHARNLVTSELLGLGDLTRRYFVVVPAEGEPTAVMHGIEEAPWTEWPWARRVYVGWRPLESTLRELLGGMRRVAMEISPGDAVPALDLVPYGVVDLVRAAGPDVVSSGELVTRFYSRWTAEGLASHRRTAETLAGVARDAFAHLATAIEADEEITEGELRVWVLQTMADRGAGVGADSIVANGVNAADPHYHPVGGGEVLRRGDLVLLDLWGKEADHLIYADQTWMAYLGESVPERAVEVWSVVRDARDAAVDFLRRRWDAGEQVLGHEVDDVTRELITDRGFGEAFIHRTGHSIDRSTHGMGPNIDNLETHEVRALVPGIGFSIEPGIYLPGEIGVRSEIDVYMGEAGPEITPETIQTDVFALLR